MITYYILGSIALLLFLILFSRLYVTIVWEGKLSVTVRWFLININITERAAKLAAGEKSKKPRKQKKEKRKKKEKEPSEPIVSSVVDIISLIKNVVFTAGNRFSRKLRIDSYLFNLTVGTGDAAKTAIVYGTASGAVYSLSEALFEHKARRKSAKRFSVSVIPDFTAEKSDVNVKIRASIRVHQALGCLISGGTGFMRYYKNKQQA